MKHTHAVLTIAAVLMALLSAAPSVAAAQDVFSWHVKDRYRLFNQADEASKSKVEALLDTLSRDDGHLDMKDHYGSFLKLLSGPGAANLRSSNWNASTRRYHDAYLSPKGYQIEARLPGTQTGRCHWTVTRVDDGTTSEAHADCADAVVLSIPASATSVAPVDDKVAARAEVAVSISGAAPRRQTVEIRDVLIVALGDSFISGEGNPDVPADLSGIAPKSRKFQKIDWPARLDPKEDRFTIAQWWDEPCHRSLLSWPVTSTLAMAAKNPHDSLTLVHLGCSGATSDEGIVGRQPDIPGCPRTLDELRTCPASRGEAHSQIEQLQHLLGTGPRRKIDKVLLSIGGNDAGFVGVIQYGLVPPNGYRLGPVVPFAINRAAPAVCPDGWSWSVSERNCVGRSARERLEDLPNNYARIAEELKALGVSEQDVVQAQYPDILHAEDETFCHHALLERDLDFWSNDSATADLHRAYHKDFPERAYPAGFEAMQTVIPAFLRGNMRWSFQYAMEPGFRCTQAWGGRGTDSRDNSEVCKSYRVWKELNSKVAANKATHTWTVVDGHVTATKGHGWCMASPAFPLDLPVADIATQMWKFDRASGDLPAPLAAAGHRGLNGFDPYDINRPRWFRTANDSFLTQYGGRGRIVQGSVHPTFRAHIAYAQAVLDEALLAAPPRSLSGGN